MTQFSSAVGSLPRTLVMCGCGCGSLWTVNISASRWWAFGNRDTILHMFLYCITPNRVSFPLQVFNEFISLAPWALHDLVPPASTDWSTLYHSHTVLAALQARLSFSELLWLSGAPSLDFSVGLSFSQIPAQMPPPQRSLPDHPTFSSHSLTPNGTILHPNLGHVRRAEIIMYHFIYENLKLKMWG